MSGFLKDQWTKYRRRKTTVGIILDFLFFALLIGMIIPDSRKVISSTIIRYTMFQPGENSEVIFVDESDLSWKLISLDGATALLSDFKGKVIFLNFWATWCPPCRSEMPSIQSLYDKIKNNKNIKFILVSVEEPETVKNYLAENKFTMPVYVSDKSLTARFKVNGIPASFILNAKGHVVFKHIGSAKWDGKESINFIKGLI